MVEAPRTQNVLDREFLAIRSRAIDLAAMLDRLDRAGNIASDDARLAAIRRALEVLRASGSDRAERIQLEFSLPYQEDWREPRSGPG